MHQKNKSMLLSFLSIYFVGCIPLGMMIRYFCWKTGYPLSDAAFSQYVIIAVYLILAGIAVCLYKGFLTAELKEIKNKSGLVKRILVYGVIFLALVFTMNWVYNLFVGSLKPESQVAFEGSLGWISVAFMALVQVLCAPLVEEIVFRHILQNEFEKATHSPLLAIVLSAVIFGLFHSGISWLLFVYVSGGILLGWIYKKTDCLVAVIAIHAVNNLLSIL